MALRKNYIPKKDKDFFVWQGQLVDKVAPNLLAWNIPPAAFAVLTTQRAIYEPLYLKAEDKSLRTRGDVTAHREARQVYEKEIRNFAHEYLMTNHLVTDADRRNLGLTVHKTEPSPGRPITDEPIIGLKGLGGGDIEVRVRVTRDKTLPSMHPDANVVDYRYEMMEIGDIPPANPEDCRKADSSTKAKFVLRAGAQNAGKRLWGYFRWLHNKRPRQEGPWTTVQNVVIA